MDQRVSMKDAWRSMVFGFGLVLFDIEKPRYWLTQMAALLVFAVSLFLIKLGLDDWWWLTFTTLVLAALTAIVVGFWIRLRLGDWVDEYNARIGSEGSDREY